MKRNTEQLLLKLSGRLSKITVKLRFLDLPLSPLVWSKENINTCYIKRTLVTFSTYRMLFISITCKQHQRRIFFSTNTFSILNVWSAFAILVEDFIDNFPFSFSVLSCYDNPRYGRYCLPYWQQRYCLIKRNFMLQNCPRTCGFCSVSGSKQCRNEASNKDCSYWQRSGYCVPGNIYYQHMQRNCKYSCGLCWTKLAKRSTTPVTTTATTMTATAAKSNSSLLLIFHGFLNLVKCILIRGP